MIIGTLEVVGDVFFLFLFFCEIYHSLNFLWSGSGDPEPILVTLDTRMSVHCRAPYTYTFSQTVTLKGNLA